MTEEMQSIDHEEEQINHLIDKADYAREINRPDIVLDCGFQILKIEPEHPLGYMALGTAYYLKGDIMAAEEAVDKSIALFAELPHSWNLKGLIFHRGHQKPKEAISYFQKALELHPEYFSAMLNFAEAEFDLDHLDHAEELVMQARMLNPEEEGCSLLLGMIYSKRGELDMAEPFYQEALKLNPENTVVLLNYGHFLLVTCNTPKKAYPILREVMRLNPNDKTAQTYFHQVLKAKNRVYGWYWSYQLWLGRLGFWRWPMVILIVIIGRLTGLIFIFLVFWLLSFGLNIGIRRGWIR